LKTYFFILSLLFAAVSFPASANYAINGQCFVTATEALDSFNANFPKLVTAGTTSISFQWFSVSSASIVGQNLTVVMRTGNTNQAAYTMPIQNCTAPTVSPFDVTQALAAFAFFFSAVILVFVVSHSGGVILETIRTGGRSRH